MDRPPTLSIGKWLEEQLNNSPLNLYVEQKLPVDSPLNILSYWMTIGQIQFNAGYCVENEDRNFDLKSYASELFIKNQLNWISSLGRVSRRIFYDQWNI